MEDMSYDNNTSAPRTAIIEPCRFPRFDKGEDGPGRLLSIRVELDKRQKLQNVFGQDRLPSVLRTAWALVLGCYTGLEDVCFGYQDLRSHSLNDCGASNHEEVSSSLVTAHLKLVGTSSLEELILTEGKNEMHSFRPTRMGDPSLQTSEQEPPFNTLVFLKTQPEMELHASTVTHGQLPDVSNSLQVSLVFFNGISNLQDT